MRRVLTLALIAVGLLGVAVPGAYAQAPAPTPQVTITGFLDTITSWTKNDQDSLLQRSGDKEWYARNRGRIDIIGALGAAKMVWGIEIDSVWGTTAATGADNNLAAGGTGAQRNGATSAFDLNTDTQGSVETKWLYTEFPMPLVPFPTIVRLGAQPFATAANYKLAVYANGDFPGVNLYTTFSPNFKLQLTYAALDETLTGKQDNFPLLAAGTIGTTNQPGKCLNSANATVACQPQSRGDNFAIIVSPEITPFKGLDIKPMYSYVFINGATNTARQGRGGVVTLTSISAASGAQTNSPFAPANGLIGGNDGAGTGVHEHRHTIGVDARWRMGPFQFDPTFMYQGGSRQAWCLGGQSAPYCAANTKHEANIRAFFVDLRGGFQFGPLLLQGMGMWTSGDPAKSNPYKHIGFFQPLDTDTSYAADWGTQILSLGVDYYQIINGGAAQAGLNPGVAIGYDKYGRLQVGARVNYALTPALTFYAVGNVIWTDKSVDTDGTIGNGILPSFVDRTTGRSARPEGDSRFIGTELGAGMTWRFVPGISFDWTVGYLFAGGALAHRHTTSPYCEAGKVNSASCQPPDQKDGKVNDIFISTARVRFTF